MDRRVARYRGPGAYPGPDRAFGCRPPGDHRNLEGGVSELRLHLGPGYRVYYTKRGDTLIILLVGGDRSTQRADIRKAQQLVRVLEEES